MKRQDMKRLLKELSKPVKNELFSKLYTEDEIALMTYLYIDKINQGWVSDELGISIPTLTDWHNSCVDQLLNYYNYEKYKFEHNEDSCFGKYFNL